MWKLTQSNKSPKTEGNLCMLQLPSCPSSKEKNIEVLLSALHYHGPVETNNKTNKKVFRNKQKQSILVTAQHSQSILVTTILHVWIFVEVHYLGRNLRGRKKGKRGKFNFTILQNKSLDKFLLIKTLSKFPFSFRYQFTNSCKILQKLRFFWPSTSDVEVFCCETNSYWKIFSPPVL